MVNYGLVLGMSTRKGTVVFLEQIIREASSVMHEQMKKNQEKYAAVEDPEQTSLGVVTFAFRLAHAISSAWETVIVKGEADVERARARMWLYLCARDVLGAAMR